MNANDNNVNISPLNSKTKNAKSREKKIMSNHLARSSPIFNCNACLCSKRKGTKKNSLNAWEILRF
jgi:hypothetical protein